MKVAAVALIGVVAVWSAAAAVIPQLTDPEQSLKRIAKSLAFGPKNQDEAKRLRGEFDQAMRNYLSRVGKLPDAQLAAKLQQVLPASIFEFHFANLPRGLKIVEIDTVLQAADYLVMKSGSGVKVFPLAGLEVFDDARLINESAGPMLVLLGHSGQTPRRPQVKVYALLPDDITDETEKLLPPIRGDGTAKFTKNGRDITLDLSLLSLGQSEHLFASANRPEDGTVHQFLEWKDAHYTSRYEYGIAPFTALYAVARCLRYPELLQTHSHFLGTKGQQLVTENKSPEAGNFKVAKVWAQDGTINYTLSGNVGTFKIGVRKESGIWTVVSATSTTIARNKPMENPVAKEPVQAKIEPMPAPAVLPDSKQEPADAPKPTASLPQKPSVPPISIQPRVPEQSIVKVSPSQPKFVEKPTAAVPPNQPKSAEKPTVAAAVQTKTPERPTSIKVEPSTAEISKFISANSVKLRREPGTQSRALTEMSRGANIQIVGKHNGWYKVRYKGQEGYVYGGLVDYKKPDAYTTARVTKTKAVTDVHRMPLSLPQLGDRLVILGGIENDKYKVQLANGKTGYVDKDAVDVAVEAPPLVP